MTKARLMVLASEARTSISSFALELIKRGSRERGAADRLAEQTHAAVAAVLQLLVRQLERAGESPESIRALLEDGLAHGLEEARQVADPVASILSAAPLGDDQE
ncbi:MAG: hypothetical protein K8I65_10635 [Thermoanaerobaculia bacterium]|nr:hypothetical protein [Thermoanaerobaculia bacterium]